MALNQYDDYEALAKLLYPSIEASGNVYYGQTRKLTMDEVFDKNGRGFHSHIESFRHDEADDSSERETFFCWNLGPMKGSVRVPNVLPSVPMCFAKYELNTAADDVENINVISSGQFKTYERNISASFVSIEITRGKIPGKDEVWNGANFYLVTSGAKNYLYVALKDSYEYADYSYEEPPYTDGNELAITCKCDENAFALIAMDCVGFVDYNNIYEYSKNGGAPEPFVVPGSQIELHNGDTVKFKLVTNAVKPQCDASHYTKFNISKGGEGNFDIILSGDIRSIQSDKSKISSSEFYRLFYQCAYISDASKLELLSKIVEGSGCADMFRNCGDLRLPPLILPAQQLSSSCYHSMFCECINLLRTPELPATNLTSGSEYALMFQDCSKLTNACVLPALQASDGCYSDMFYGCHSLKKPPRILAILSGNESFAEMFYDSGIEYSPITYGTYTPTEFSNKFRMMCMESSDIYEVYSYIYFKDEADPTHSSNWLSGADTVYKFHCDPEAAWIVNSSDGIPNDCERVDIYKEYKDGAADLQHHSKYTLNDSLITSGTESVFSYGRSVDIDYQKGNLRIETPRVNPLYDVNAPQLNTFSCDGSYNQSVYGWKCFNGPVSFRGGLYTDNTSFIDETFISENYYERDTYIVNGGLGGTPHSAGIDLHRTYEGGKAATYASVTISNLLTVTSILPGEVGNGYSVEIESEGAQFIVKVYIEDQLAETLHAANVNDLHSGLLYFDGTLTICSRTGLSYGEDERHEKESFSSSIASTYSTGHDTSTSMLSCSCDTSRVVQSELLSWSTGGTAKVYLSSDYGNQVYCKLHADATGDAEATCELLASASDGESHGISVWSTNGDSYIAADAKLIKLGNINVNNDSNGYVDFLNSTNSSRHYSRLKLTSDDTGPNGNVRSIRFESTNLAAAANSQTNAMSSITFTDKRSADKPKSEIVIKSLAGTINESSAKTSFIRLYSQYITGQTSIIDVDADTVNVGSDNGDVYLKGRIHGTIDAAQATDAVHASYASNLAYSSGNTNTSLLTASNTEEVTVKADLVPETTATYNLGSNEICFAFAHISEVRGTTTNMQFVDTTGLAVGNSGASFTGVASFTGNANFTGDASFTGDLSFSKINKSSMCNDWPSNDDADHIKLYENVINTFKISNNADLSSALTGAKLKRYGKFKQHVWAKDNTLFLSQLNSLLQHEDPLIYDAIEIRSNIHSDGNAVSNNYGGICIFTGKSFGEECYTSYGNILKAKYMYNLSQTELDPFNIKIQNASGQVISNNRANYYRIFAGEDNCIGYSNNTYNDPSATVYISFNNLRTIYPCTFSEMSFSSTTPTLIFSTKGGITLPTVNSIDSIAGTTVECYSDFIADTTNILNVIEIMPDMIYVSLPIKPEYDMRYSSERGFIFTKNNNTWGVTHISLKSLDLTDSPFRLTKHLTYCTARYNNDTYLNVALNNNAYHVYNEYYLDAVGINSANFFANFIKVN